MVIAVFLAGAALCFGSMCALLYPSIFERRERARCVRSARRAFRGAQAQRVSHTQRVLEVSDFMLDLPFVGSFSEKAWSIQRNARRLLGVRTPLVQNSFDEAERKLLRQRLGLVSLASALVVFVVSAILVHNPITALALSATSFWLMPSLFGVYAQKMSKKKRLRYEKSIPEMLSVIVLSVQAGATFDTALESYATQFDSELARRARATYELYISQVVSRSDALDALARDVDSELFYRFVSTVKRALYLGSPLALALDGQLRDIRNYRAERIKEEIAKKPVQILLPLGVCILPGMLILLLGPILMEVMQGITMR